MTPVRILSTLQATDRFFKSLLFEVGPVSRIPGFCSVIGPLSLANHAFTRSDHVLNASAFIRFVEISAKFQIFPPFPNNFRFEATHPIFCMIYRQAILPITSLSL